ncbi:hypothetical protein MNBD_GAMMA04-1289 [hydrothermal vent metagenome]|uniref:Uncharacterized protein n=1 Tax=hydrothermal vent metagenome TaxID=652676 RepID=A0A3B0WB08_9ZZZZ
MNNKIKKNKSVKDQVSSKQSGFIILMGLLILVLGAATWFGTAGNLRSEGMKLSSQSDDVENLERIKDKMLTYALLYPGIFGDGNDTPGPGYFPCPDTTGDSQSNGGCVAGNALFVIGMVPQRIVARQFSFLSSNQENRRYWFAVDSRYLNRNPILGSLNSLTSSLVDTAGGAGFCNDPNVVPPVAGPLPATCVAPITLDGRGDIVMILFYAGDPLNQQRGNLAIAPGFANAHIGAFLEQPALPAIGAPANFVSVGANPDNFNDRIVTITREEWNATMLSLVAMDANNDGVVDLCTIPDGAVGAQSWFNRCSQTPFDQPNNPCIPAAIGNLEGQGWRFVLGC